MKMKKRKKRRRGDEYLEAEKDAIAGTKKRHTQHKIHSAHYSGEYTVTQQNTPSTRSKGVYRGTQCISISTDSKQSEQRKVQKSTVSEPVTGTRGMRGACVCVVYVFERVWCVRTMLVSQGEPTDNRPTQDTLEQYEKERGRHTVYSTHHSAQESHSSDQVWSGVAQQRTAVTRWSGVHSGTAHSTAHTRVKALTRFAVRCHARAGCWKAKSDRQFRKNTRRTLTERKKRIEKRTEKEYEVKKGAEYQKTTTNTKNQKITTNRTKEKNRTKNGAEKKSKDSITRATYTNTPHSRNVVFHVISQYHHNHTHLWRHVGVHVGLPVPPHTHLPRECLCQYHHRHTHTHTHL